MSSKKIRKTQEYKDWKRIIKGGRQFPLDAHFAEVMQLHEQRKSTKLAFGKYNARKLSEANAFDINIRAIATKYMVLARNLLVGVSMANQDLINFLHDKRLLTKGTVADRNERPSMWSVRDTSWKRGWRTLFK